MHKLIYTINDEIKKYMENKKEFAITDIRNILPLVQAAEGLIALEKFTNKKEDKYSDIIEEIEGAEKYYKIYKDNGDIDFLDMAKDETRHAKKYLKGIDINSLSEADKKAINKYINEYNSIVDKIEAEERAKPKLI